MSLKGDDVDPDETEAVESSDEDVPSPEGAKALGVSYRTINRVVEDGDLERVGRGLISKRSLVRALEDRRDSGPRRRGVTAEQLSQLTDVVASLSPNREVFYAIGRAPGRAAGRSNPLTSRTSHETA